MKPFLFYLILLFSFTWLKAQNTYLDYKYSIKLYNLTAYEQSSENGIVDSLMPMVRNSSTTLQYVHPTFAFQWKTKKQNFKEIELINFYINKTTGSREQLDTIGRVEKVLSKKVLVSSGISLRYEYTVMFKKLKTSKFVPSIGYAANPYFKLDNFVPELSNAFISTKSTLGARGFIIPRLTYFIGSKFFLDLNLPFCVMELYYQVNENENPMIPSNQQRISNINFELFPKVFSARLGLGLKI